MLWFSRNLKWIACRWRKPAGTPRIASGGRLLIAMLILAAFLGMAWMSEPMLVAQDSKQDAKPTVAIDRQDVDQDFGFQGEFVGELDHGDGPRPVGLQVIALGKGKFKAVLYSGGLPGAGFDGNMRSEIEGEGTLDPKGSHPQLAGAEGIVTFAGDARGTLYLAKEAAVALDPQSQPMATFERVSRQSKTLGENPPAGATVLFDGTSAEGWTNGKLSPEGYLMQGTTSKATLGDHRLHLEFLLPYKPEARGQGRGNSGLYIQGRWEIQMLDSFGLTGEQNECGGLYSVAKPDLNMCLPPLTWQTYDIEFTAEKYEGDQRVSPARITVYHNGVKIHDDVELPNRKSTAAPVEVGPEKGPIYLQDHGNPVRYRNIWAVEAGQ